MYQDIQFIVCFLAINFLCFSLGYLINIRQQPNPFYFTKVDIRDTRSFLRNTYRRNTSDFLRINLECSLLVLLFKFVHVETSLASHLISIVSLWGLVNITYIYAIVFFFRRSPLLKADATFISVGLTLAKNKKYLILGAVLLLSIIFYYLFFRLSTNLLSLKGSTIIYFLIFSWIALFGFKNLFGFPFTIYHMRGVLSPTIHFFKNAINSNKYLSLLNFEESEVSSKNIYSDFRLRFKPDIVFISIESFGSIAYKDEEVFTKVKKVLIDYQEKFSVNGIHIASSYSTPPQFAGGSWLSVGSLIYGYKMENDVKYHALFKNQSNFKGYKSMIHYFKDQGYDATMIATLGGYEEFDVDWEKVKNVYPMDSFIKWEDIGYVGKMLDFMNLPFSPPDQYSLWKGMELINSKTMQPKISLFTTLNSHCNWHSPLTLEDDYKQLNFINNFETTRNTKKPRKVNYASSIVYQLEVVFDYVSKNPDRIFVIFGDHQPPFITSESFGFETPLYVLSTNQELIDGFRREGFHEGLTILNNNIRHEGFYSLFMKSFLQVYSDNSEKLPILRDGIIFEKKSSNGFETN